MANKHPKYTDFQFIADDYGKAAEYHDDNALVLAIRNILLSKPGNYPFNPSLGMNIKKYQFDFLDSQTLSEIKDELSRSIARYIPDTDAINVSVQKIEGDDGKTYLGISVKANMNGEDTVANFILKENLSGTVDVLNEIY